MLITVLIYDITAVVYVWYCHKKSIGIYNLSIGLIFNCRSFHFVLTNASLFLVEFHCVCKKANTVFKSECSLSLNIGLHMVIYGYAGTDTFIGRECVCIVGAC